MRFMVKCISSGERAGARPAVVALRSVAEQLAEFFAERFAAQLRGDDLAVGAADQEGMLCTAYASAAGVWNPLRSLT